MSNKEKSIQRLKNWRLHSGHRLSWLMTYFLSQRGVRIFFAIIGVTLVIGILTWIWWPIFFPKSVKVIAWLPWALFGLLVPLAVGFVLLVSNFKTLKDRVHEALASDLEAQLDALSSSLAQTNLLAASVSVRYSQESNGDLIERSLSPVVPEHVLRHFDAQLHIKDTMASLDKVMRARRDRVQSRVGDIVAEQQRARRTATAAVGGMVAGFFAYQVGDSVLKYVLVQGRSQDSDPSPSLFTVPAQRDNLGGPQVTKAAPGKTVQSALPSEVKLKISTDTLDQNELLGHAWLLTITLLISLLAGWVGWRKPTEELNGK